MQASRSVHPPPTCACAYSTDMEDTEALSEPVFRANKRRKVFRKRRASDEDRDELSTKVEAGSGVAEIDDDGDAVALRMQKRGGMRKNGIGFSSTGDRRAAPRNENEEMALVPASQDLGQEMQNDRFVKPVGREVVTEDKHMYVILRRN